MVDLEDILAFRVDDFYLSKIDTRVLVYYGITNRYDFFMGIVEEGSKEKDRTWYDLGIIAPPWESESKRFYLSSVQADIWDIAEKKDFFEGMEKQWEDKRYRKAKQYLLIRAKKIVEVIIPRMIDVYASYFGFTDEQIRSIFKINHRISSPKTQEVRLFPVLKERWTEEEFSFFLSDMQKLPPAQCRHVIAKLFIEYSDPDFDDYLFEVKTTPSFIKRCKYRLAFDEEDQRIIDKIGVLPKTRIQYFFFKVIASDPTLHKIIIEDGEYEESETDKSEILKKLATLDLDTWHEFKEYMHIKGPYSLQELRHMLNTVFDGIMIYDNARNRTNIREIVKENNIRFVEVKGSPRKIVQRAIFNHRQAVEVEKIKLLKQKNEPMPLPPVKLPEWIENIRLKTKHDLIIAGMECRHCIGSYTHSKDVFVREGDVCAQIYRFNLSVGQCFDKNDQITKRSEDLRKRLEKALTPVAEKNRLRK